MVTEDKCITAQVEHFLNVYEYALSVGRSNGSHGVATNLSDYK